jgi:hypothetical protein
MTNSDFLSSTAKYGWVNRKPGRTLQETAEYVQTERERWRNITRELDIHPK